jgi:hypothetical protein
MKKIKALLKDEKAEVIITEAFCDICASNCIHDGIFEGMELKVDWGYFSKKDGEKWRAIICENCVDKHIVPIIKFDINY